MKKAKPTKKKNDDSTTTEPEVRSTGSISSITLQGFKSIRNETMVEIRPLTIIAGRNSSGKSSLMQSLLLLKQTLEAVYDPGALKLDGPNVAFRYAREILSKLNKKSSAETFSVRVGHDAKAFVKVYFKRQRLGFSIQQMDVESEEISGVIKPGLASEDLAGFVPEKYVNMMRSLLDVIIDSDDDSAKNIKKTFQLESPTYGVIRERCFLAIGRAFESGDLSSGPAFPLMPVQKVAHALRGIIHLPGLRGNPARDYPIGAVGSTYPGPFQSYVASIILRWQESRGRTPLKALFADLQHLELAASVRARRITDASVELRVPRTSISDPGDNVSIVDVGVGVSQVLPVLVALHAANKGQIVYVEQPEIHLHPKAQLGLAKCIIDAIGRGVNVIVETHSALLILGIQIAVAKKDLRPELAKLHWFTLDTEGMTQVASHDFAQDGSFGEWPEDFADITLTAQRAFLDAVADGAFRDA